MPNKSYYNIEGKALGSTKVEYESLEKAAAEIVDNSIEANASKICIFVEAKHNLKSGKKETGAIAFLDNGKGMNPEELQEYVRDGSSSKRETGIMGKFGVGLNQASLFASPVFEVYSWIKRDEVFYQRIDAREMETNPYYEVTPSIKTEYPAQYYLDDSFKDHGTIVVWPNLKKESQHMPATVADHLDDELGRMFRRYISSGKISIYISSEFKKPEYCMPRDPMFLIENDYFLGDPEGGSKKADKGEPIFEPYVFSGSKNGSLEYMIPYFDKDENIKFSKVVLSASIVKEKFYYKAAYKDGYDKPGDTEIGKYARRMAKGITVLRGDREIDFKYFDFYDSTNTPHDRWFKIQIEFTRELDDIFGVSNNKQHIEMRKVDDPTEITIEESSPSYPIWLRFNQIISKLVGEMRSRNSKLAKDAKEKEVRIKHNAEKKKEKDKSAFEKKIDDEGIVLTYDKIDEYYTHYFDKELDKEVLVLNKSIFDEKSDKKIICIIALMIKELVNRSSNSEGFKAIEKVLDNYIHVYKEYKNNKESY